MAVTGEKERERDDVEAEEQRLGNIVKRGGGMKMARERECDK